ncbi:MAG: YciI family protein [Gammaproteobacteria bacterium]|nr:YciI family protein [Gammaproteobacteria bacterium]
MLYVIIGHAAPGSHERRAKARPDHLKRLTSLQDEGRLVVAGPLPAVDSPDPGPAGYTGGLIIAEFPSLSAATTWAHDDPYVHADVYHEITIKPFVQALP